MRQRARPALAAGIAAQRHSPRGKTAIDPLAAALKVEGESIDGPQVPGSEIMILRKVCPLLAALILLPALAKATDPPAAKAAQQKDQPKKDAPPQSIQVRYAQAYLALARLDLQIAKDRNKLVAKTLPAALILTLEAHVVMAEKWLAAAENKDSAGGVNIAVEAAQIEFKLAEANYARAVEANRLQSISPQAMARLKLKAEVAELNLAAAKELDPSSPAALMAFQLDRLSEQVAELRIRQVQILDRN
jgi:hypothetical protein